MIIATAAATAGALTATAAAGTPARAATDTQPPTTPRGLTLTSVTSSAVGLSWRPSTDDVGVTGYDILRAQGRQSFRLHATVAGTTYTDTGLIPGGVTYRYMVRARDAAGNRSTLSNEVDAVTLGTGG